MLLASGFCVLLLADVLQLVQPRHVAWTLALQIAFVCVTAGLALFPAAVNVRHFGGVVAAAAIAAAGSAAGLGMPVLFRVRMILAEAQHEAALATLRSSRVLTFTTLVPGILFPLGLLGLAVALYRKRLASTPALAVLIGGAALFPVGHAVGVPIAMIVGDVLLVLAAVLLLPAASREAVASTAAG